MCCYMFHSFALIDNLIFRSRFRLRLTPASLTLVQMHHVLNQFLLGLTHLTKHHPVSLIRQVDTCILPNLLSLYRCSLTQLLSLLLQYCWQPGVLLHHPHRGAVQQSE